MDNYIKDLDYEYTCKIKYDSAVPPAWDRTLNVGWSRLPRGSKEGEGDDVAAFKAMTASNTRKVGHWDYFTLPANVALKICRYIIQQHSTDKPIRLSRLSVYSGLYPITEDTDRDVWESEFFETPKQASRAVTPYLLVSRGFRTNLSAAFLLTRRYHFVVSPFDHVTDLNWLARNGPCLKNITMEFDCTRYYGGKPQTREKVEAAKHPGGVDKEQLKTALAPGKDARESVKHYKRVLLPMLEMLTSGREFPVNRLTIMVRKYQGSRESMPQGYPYFDPTWLNFLLVIPCVLQSNVRNLETIGVPPKLLGLIINRFWGEGKPPTEDAQRQHFTWSPSPPTLWPEMSGQSAAISVPGSLDLTVQYLLTLDHPGKVEIRAFPSQEAQKEQQEQQSAKKRKSKRKKKKTKKSSILPEEAPIPQPERVVEPEEQSGEQAHSQPPSRLSVMTPYLTFQKQLSRLLNFIKPGEGEAGPSGSSTATATAAADVEADSSPEREPGAMRCLDRLGSWGLGRWWDGRKEAEPADQGRQSQLVEHEKPFLRLVSLRRLPKEQVQDEDEDAMSSPERKALHLQRARDKFMELSNLLEASFPAPPISSETLAAPGTGTLSTQTGLGVPRATLAGPLLPPPPKPATPQQPHSHLPVTPALPGPSAVSIPMPDGKRTRLTDEDRQPSSAGSTPNGNDAGDLSESRGSGDTRSGHRTASGSTSCPAAGNDIKTGTPQAGSSASTAIESKAPAGNAAAGTTTGAAAVEDNDKGLGLWETNNTTFSVEKGWIMVLRKKKKKNKKAGENKCVKPGGTSTSTSSSKEAESKAGLPQSPQAARPSPPPPSDLHIAGSNLGDSSRRKAEDKDGKSRMATALTAKKVKGKTSVGSPPFSLELQMPNPNTSKLKEEFLSNAAQAVVEEPSKNNAMHQDDPKGEERSGSQSPPWLQWSSFSEASLPTPWLSMEVPGQAGVQPTLPEKGESQSQTRSPPQSPSDRPPPLETLLQLPMKVPKVRLSMVAKVLEVPKEQVLNESAEDVKAREGVDADQFNFPTSSQDTRVCSIVSTVARNPKAKGKARWTGSPKPPDEDKDVESTRVESNPVSRPQPQPQPQLSSLQPEMKIAQAVIRQERIKNGDVRTQTFPPRPQGQPQRPQGHLYPGAPSPSTPKPPSQQPLLSKAEASALYYRYLQPKMLALNMLPTMAGSKAQVSTTSQVPTISQAPSISAPSISQGQVLVMHPLHPISQMPTISHMPAMSQMPPTSQYFQVPTMSHIPHISQGQSQLMPQAQVAAMHPLQPTIQVPPIYQVPTISPVPAVSQVQMQPMPQMQPIVQIFNYYQVPTTTMSQVPPNPPAHASQPTHPFQQPYQAPQSMYLGHERCNAQRCYQETPEHFHPPNMYQLPPHPMNPELFGVPYIPPDEVRPIYPRECLPSGNTYLMPKAPIPNMNVPTYPAASGSGQSGNGNGNGLAQYRVPVPAPMSMTERPHLNGLCLDRSTLHERRRKGKEAMRPANVEEVQNKPEEGQ